MPDSPRPEAADEARYEREKDRVIQAMKAVPFGFLSYRDLQKLVGYSPTMARMEREGLVRATYFRGGGYELV